MFNNKDLKNPDWMKKAKEYWSYLDNLAESDPSSYKKFINTNLEKGKEVMKENFEKNKEKNSISISDKNIYKTIRFISNIKYYTLEKNKENEKFLINKPQENNNNDNNKISYNEEAKIYFNILISDKIDKPTNEKNEDIDLKNTNLWKKIPYSCNKPDFKDDIDYMRIYYNFIINNEIIKFLNNDINLFNNMVNYIITIYSNFKFKQKNIWFEYFKDNKLPYYDIDPKSLKVKLKYKSKLSNILPNKIFLETKPENPKQDNSMKKQDIIYKKKEINNNKNNNSNIDIEISKEPKKGNIEVVKEVKNILISENLDISSGILTIVFYLGDVCDFKDISLKCCNKDLKIKFKKNIIVSHIFKVDINKKTIKANWKKNDKILSLTVKKINN